MSKVTRRSQCVYLKEHKTEWRCPTQVMVKHVSTCTMSKEVRMAYIGSHRRKVVRIGRKQLKIVRTKINVDELLCDQVGKKTRRWRL